MSELGKLLTIGVVAEVHHGVPPAEPVRWHNELLLDRTAELLDKAVSALRELSLDALVLLGDLSNYADDASLGHVARTVAAPEMPVYVVPGNHDIDGHPDAVERFSRQLRHPGIVVAPALVETESELPVMLVGLRRDARSNDLSSVSPGSMTDVKAHSTVVFSHFPLLPLSGQLESAGLRHAGDLSNRENLLQEVDQIPGPVIAVHGHLHVRASQAAGKLLQLSCAALVEPPHEVTIIELSGFGDGAFSVKRTAVNIEPHSVETLPVLSPPDEEWRFMDGRWTSTSSDSKLT